MAFVSDTPQIIRQLKFDDVQESDPRDLICKFETDSKFYEEQLACLNSIRLVLDAPKDRSSLFELAKIKNQISEWKQVYLDAETKQQVLEALLVADVIEDVPAELLQQVEEELKKSKKSLKEIKVRSNEVSAKLENLVQALTERMYFYHLHQCRFHDSISSLLLFAL
eukprot:ANDGO_03915.mRNA.1 hypothetical protein